MTVRACALLAIALLTSCAGKRISDIDAPAAPGATSSGTNWSVPSGIVVTAAQRGAAEISGLYPSTVPDDRRCCWLATDADVVVRATRTPATLHVDVLVPDYPFFQTTPQSLELHIGQRVERTGPLAPGVHRLEFDAVSSDRPGGRLIVHFRSARAFVPAREGVNADTRALGIILLGMSFS